MQIVCPHCTTSYAVNAATFGSAGRTVRCARCKETWLAQPEEVTKAFALAPGADAGGGPGWDDPRAPEETKSAQIPVIESPSITSDLPDGSEHSEPAREPQWTAGAQHDEEETDGPLRRRRGRAGSSPSMGPLAKRGGLPIGIPGICAGLAAVVLGLIVWRADVVRLMPQTAMFFKMVGLGVNLRGLAFEDIKISTELVDNKPVLIIEGNIVDVTKKTVEIPRLRFLVRDAHGTEIYAWNAVLDQAVLKAGEKAWFKSRLASPPLDGREIAVRFFSKKDLAAGGS